MRQVRTCDFCGDDATGVYEPLPPSIPDAPRMSLCDACRDRLSSVVDPLLAELGGDQDEDTASRAARAPGDLEAEAASREADGGAGADRATDGQPADPEAREWPADPRDPADGAPERSGDEATNAADRPDRPAEEAPDSVPSSSDASGTSGIGDTSDASDDVDTPEAAEDADVEVSESRDASGRTQRERGGAPRGYRKVMRFLENRQLPVDRAEAERLAAEAYELDVGEVAAAIDHAVQYGRLREVSGELRR